MEANDLGGFGMYRCCEGVAHREESIGDEQRLRGRVDLAVTDMRSCSDEGEHGDLVSRLHRIVRRGGTVVAVVDPDSLTAAAEAFSERFKQLRFVEVAWPGEDMNFHPVGNRLMGITAVKGGGSTFRTKYHGGLYAEDPSEDPLGVFLENVFAIHSAPGAVAVIDPAVEARMEDSGRIRFPVPESAN